MQVNTDVQALVQPVRTGDDVALDSPRQPPQTQHLPSAVTTASLQLHGKLIGPQSL